MVRLLTNDGFMYAPAGMDPLSRKRVWEMIEQLKKDHILLLTTHSMEEADILGDKVAIMATGQLKVCGTSLYLKNRYGAGFQLSLLTNPENSDRLVKMVKSRIPGVDIVGNAAGALTIGVPKTSRGYIPQFFEGMLYSQGFLISKLHHHELSGSLG